MKRVVTLGILILLLNIFLSSVVFANGKKDKPGVEESEGNITLPMIDLAPVSSRKKKVSYKAREVQGGIRKMREVWGYLMAGREAEQDKKAVITDIGYFSAEVNAYGALVNVPNKRKIKGWKGRVHLVLTCDSRAKTHFLLQDGEGIRKALIDDVMREVRQQGFDGVQVDYELIAQKDVKAFWKFLEVLGKRVREEGKVFSVCVPARVKTVQNDAFSYSVIEKLCDKVIIMAYDEHWSTSVPGPIASVKWCKSVVKYAKTVIPDEKLVMGLPFYGRSWADKRVANAWYYSGMNRLIKENKSSSVEYEDGVPKVEIETKVKMNCYFEDAYSTMEKISLYQDYGVDKLAFWRLGQEDSYIWEFLRIKQE